MASSADIDRILATIRTRESGNNYGAQNPYSKASGAYQYLNSTWASKARAAGFGQYANQPAKKAPREVQDAVARWDVEQMLRSNKGDIRAVPALWYYPAGWGRVKAGQDVRPPGRGNPLSMLQYISRWMKTYNNPKGVGVAGPPAPAGTPSRGSTTGMAGLDQWLTLDPNANIVNRVGPAPQSEIDPLLISQLGLALADAPVEFPDPQKAYDALLRLSQQRTEDLRRQYQTQAEASYGTADQISAAIQQAAAGMGAEGTLAGLRESARSGIQQAAMAAANRYQGRESEIMAEAASRLWNEDLSNRGRLAADTPKNRIDAVKTYLDMFKGRDAMAKMGYEQLSANVRAEEAAATTRMRGNQSVAKSAFEAELDRRNDAANAAAKLYQLYVQSGMKQEQARSAATKGGNALAAVQEATASYTPVARPGEDHETPLLTGSFDPDTVVKELARRTFYAEEGDTPYARATATALMAQYATTYLEKMRVGQNEQGKSASERAGRLPMSQAELLSTMQKQYDLLTGEGLDPASKEEIRGYWLVSGALADGAAIMPVAGAAASAAGRRAGLGEAAVGAGISGAAGGAVAAGALSGAAGLAGAATAGAAAAYATTALLDRFIPQHRGFAAKWFGRGGTATRGAVTTPAAINSLVAALIDPNKGATTYARLENNRSILSEAEKYPQLKAAMAVGRQFAAIANSPYQGSAAAGAANVPELQNAFSILDQIYGG